MRRLTTLVAALCCLIAAGCSGQAAPGQNAGPVEYAKDGTFTMAVSTELTGFDPYRHRGMLGLSYLAYDSLVNQLPDGKFVSGLAEKWTVDPRSVTFTLRPDVTCSDGTPLTAAQVAAAVRFVADPNNESPQYTLPANTVPVTVTADDTARTVTVAVRSPFGLLLHSVGLLPIVCAKGMADPKLMATASDGTGPFVLTEVVPGQSYTFTRRDGYVWGPNGASTSAPGTPAKLTLRIIPNETTATNLLLSGEVNLAKVIGDDYQRVQARGLQRRDWTLGGAWVSFNQRGDRPTADQQVRKALIQALDGDTVLKVSTAGRGKAVTGLVSMSPNPCPGDTVTGQLPQHDTAAAATLLDQAGWRKGPDGVRAKDGKALALDLHYSPTQSSLDKPTAELLSQQWRDLGVQVKITVDSLTALANVLYETSNYDVYLTGYNFSLPSQMVPYLSGTMPPKGTNLAGIDNREYNQYAAKAVSLTPPQACEYWQRAEQAIIRSLDIAPLSNRVNSWFLQGAEAEIQRYDSPIPTSIRVTT
jgi:peptide/nickel transport system substrate-binding protein